MKRSSRPRRTAEVSKSLHQQLNMYALVAGAAGVGVLASAQPAEARVVYTPANVHLVGKPIPLDLNHDGITDFYLLSVASHGHDKEELWACQIVSSNTAGPFCHFTEGTNQIRAAMGGEFEAALGYGAKIGRGDRFILGAPMGGVRNFSHSKSNSTSWFGPWVNGGKGVKHQYLGLEFEIKGRFHFGWARITVATTKNKFTATLTGYAYETIPDKPIIAGKTKGPNDATVEESKAAVNLPPNLPRWAYSRWDHLDFPYGGGNSRQLLRSEAVLSNPADNPKIH